MSDAITKLSDVLVPTKFLPYMQEQTAQLSAFQSSGVIEQSPEIDALVNGGGKTFDEALKRALDEMAAVRVGEAA